MVAEPALTGAVLPPPPPVSRPRRRWGHVGGAIDEDSTTVASVAQQGSEGGNDAGVRKQVGVKCRASPLSASYT